MERGTKTRGRHETGNMSNGTQARINVEGVSWRKREKRDKHTRKMRNGASDCLPFSRPGNGPFIFYASKGSK